MLDPRIEHGTSRKKALTDCAILAHVGMFMKIELTIENFQECTLSHFAMFIKCFTNVFPLICKRDIVNVIHGFHSVEVVLK